MAEVTSEEWRRRARGLLREELRRRKVGYRELVERLGAMGVRENPLNIANKLGRGRFSAVFLIQCLVAIGCHQITLDFED